MKLINFVKILLTFLNLFKFSTSIQTHFIKPFESESKFAKASQFRVRQDQPAPNIFRIQIYEDSLKLAEGDFELDKVNSDKFNRGIYLSHVTSYVEDDPKTKEILIKDGDYVYLPYRTLSTDFTYTNPWFSNKYLYTVFKRTAIEDYNIYIYFPYNAAYTYVGSPEAIKIKDSFNNLRQARQTLVTNLKSTLNIAASNYISSSKFLEAYKAHISKAKQIEDINTEIKTISNSLNNEVQNLQGSNEEITKIQNKLANENYTIDGFKRKLNQLGERQKVLKDNILTLTLTKESDLNNKKIEELQAKIKKEESNYLNKEAILKQEAPQAIEIIQQANNELFKNVNIQGYQERMRSILP